MFRLPVKSTVHDIIYSTNVQDLPVEITVHDII